MRSLLGDWGFYMLPKLLYELMPVFYVSVGFAATLLLYNSYAILSGIVLLIAALMILYMRLESRTEEEAKLGVVLIVQSGKPARRQVMPRPLTQHHLAAVLEGMFGKYLEKGDYCRESNTDLLVQKRIEQRDNHRPDCWATNPDDHPLERLKRCGIVARRGRRVSSGSLTLSFLLTAERQGPCSAILQRRALGRPHHRARPYVEETPGRSHDLVRRRLPGSAGRPWLAGRDPGAAVWD